MPRQMKYILAYWQPMAPPLVLLRPFRPLGFRANTDGAGLLGRGQSIIDLKDGLFGVLPSMGWEWTSCYVLYHTAARSLSPSNVCICIPLRSALPVTSHRDFQAPKTRPSRPMAEIQDTLHNRDRDVEPLQHRVQRLL